MGRKHACTYRKLGHLCELVAVVDTFESQGRQVSSELAVGFYVKYQHIFGQVDAVSIAVPTRFHQQVTSEFLDHGIHCLVEKPMADTVDAARQMGEAANKNGVVLTVGQVERFNPVVAQLKDIIVSGSLGSIRMMVSFRVGPLPASDTPESVIMDLAIHDLDMARYLLNRESCSVYCRSGSANGSSNNSVSMIADFEGVLATAHVSWDMAMKSRSLTVFGSKGTAEADYMQQNLTLCYPEGKIQVPLEKEPPLKRELVNFLRCVGGTEELLVSAPDGLRTLDLAIKADAFARRNTSADAFASNLWGEPEPESILTLASSNSVVS